MMPKLGDVDILKKRPYLIFFAVISYFREFLFKPDRKLKVTNEVTGATSGSWSSLAPLPSYRYEFGACFVRGEVIIVGGLTAPTVYTVSKMVEAYNPSTNSWRGLSDYPRIIHHPTVVSAENRMFVVGGNGLRITPLSDVCEYSFENDSWLKKAPMPTPRGAFGSAYWGGKIYAAGGGLNKKPLSSFESYDLHKDVWEVLPEMSVAREHHCVVAAYGRIHVLGGYVKSLTGCLDTHEVFEIRTGRWEKLAPLPLKISGFSACVLGNSIFVFGGEQGWAVSGNCYEYRIDEDRWYKRPEMPSPRYAAGIAVVGDTIHLLGGNSYLLGYTVKLDHDIFAP